MPVPPMPCSGPLRQSPRPPASVYCTCGIAFEGRTEDEAVAAQEAHAAEMRNPDGHVCEPW